MAKKIDMLGTKIGMLLIIDSETRISGGRKRIYWKGLCDCGNTCFKTRDTMLRSNNRVNCGCLKSKLISDKLTKSITAGTKFGRLTVISKSENYGGRSRWECLCDCGNTHIVSRKNLIEGSVTSCGCYSLELKTKHGLYGSPLYIVYYNMIQRCGNKNHPQFNYYGAVGIEVCNRWLESFESFYEDMNEGYSEGLELDRKNNNGNYEPSNCRWVTRKQNMHNTGPKLNSALKYKGVSVNRDKFVVSVKNKYIGIYADIIEAALSYDRVAEELFGEFAWLNRNYFPEVKERYNK